jgi:hypothetical protein
MTASPGATLGLKNRDKQILSPAHANDAPGSIAHEDGEVLHPLVRLWFGQDQFDFVTVFLLPWRGRKAGFALWTSGFEKPRDLLHVIQRFASLIEIPRALAHAKWNAVHGLVSRAQDELLAFAEAALDVGVAARPAQRSAVQRRAVFEIGAYARKPF